MVLACGAVGPECDVECVACSEHEHCPQSVCDIQEGECLHLDDDGDPRDPMAPVPGADVPAP